MLTPAELLRLAGELPDRFRCVVLVAGVVGLRWSEVVGLRIGDVDFDRGTLTVSQTIAEVEGRQIVAKTKTRAGKRRISVPGFLLAELRRHVDEHRAHADHGAPLFIGPSGALLRRTFTARFLHPAVDRAGLDPRIDFHGLRHVAAGLLVEEGAPPRAMMARLGHSTQRMSMELYAHATDDLDRRIAQQLDASFLPLEPTSANPSSELSIRFRLRQDGMLVPPRPAPTARTVPLLDPQDRRQNRHPPAHRRAARLLPAPLRQPPAAQNPRTRARTAQRGHRRARPPLDATPALTRGVVPSRLVSPRSALQPPGVPAGQTLT